MLYEPGFRNNWSKLIKCLEASNLHKTDFLSITFENNAETAITFKGR